MLSVSLANAQSVADTVPLSYSTAQIFAKALRDQPAAADETAWSDVSALAYAQSRRSTPAGVQWLPQPLPAVDGLNGKIDGYGGGANHITSLYGANGSFAIPLAQQWGLQIDGGVGSFDSSGTARGGGHVFWRDPNIGLLGAYGSYAHWGGVGFATIPRIGTNFARYAAEGEYYAGRWTVGGLLGYETVRANAPVVAGLAPFSIPNRFFDAISASYYLTDNFKLSAGHIYTIGRNALTLGGEYGFALGGGRMASLFAQGVIGGGGNNVVRGGLRIYFGQHDKTLIDRNRQDDPDDAGALDAAALQFLEGVYRTNTEILPQVTPSGVVIPAFSEPFPTLSPTGTRGGTTFIPLPAPGSTSSGSSFSSF